MNLSLEVRGGAQHKTFAPGDPATLGRDPKCAFVLHVEETASRLMGTFVYDGDTWFLVVPVANEDELSKRPIEVVSTTARTRSFVDEGGWIALAPGSGIIRPDTVADVEVIWTIDGEVAPVVRDVARRENERTPVQRRSIVHVATPVAPNAAILRLVQPRDSDRVDDWEAEMQALERELADGFGRTTAGIPSTQRPRLTDRVTDFIVTAGWLHWQNGRAPILSDEQVAAIWSTTPYTVTPDGVSRAIRRGLAAFSLCLPDPVLWADDRSRALTVLRTTGALRQLHFDWQDLNIEYPEDLPSLVARSDGSVGPRRQVERPDRIRSH